ncbi:MAG: AI-2E family transporter [Hyphomonadaceae bacterium]
MTKAAIWAIFILTLAAVLAMLKVFSEMLTQVALAMILWLAIEALALHIRRLLPRWPHWTAMAIAIVGIIALFGFVLWQLITNVSGMVAQWPRYSERFEDLIRESYAVLHIAGEPPKMAALLAKVNVGSLLGTAAGGVQSLIGFTIFVLIYLGFMFPAAARIHQKLDRIFGDESDRAQVRDVLTAIRRSMAQYLWVQTVLSAMITVLTAVSLAALGLDHWIFWSFLIFFLNYIPTIGSIVAVALPTLFAVIQYPDLAHVALVAAGIGVWQFVIGNLVQPRLMGESLNLSALVVLISLALWGYLWGIVGAFLAAPLTVMIMLTLAQFKSTRWIAILLSEDGNPGVPRRARTDPAAQDAQ